MAKKALPPSVTVSPLLRERCEAITMAIHAGCAVKANIRGMMRRVAGIASNEDGAITLIYSNEEKRTVLFRVRPGTRIELSVTIEPQTEVQ
jgi:predicted metal-dependent peptidase